VWLRPLQTLWYGGHQTLEYYNLFWFFGLDSVLFAGGSIVRDVGVGNDGSGPLTDYLCHYVEVYCEVQ